jgi:3-keto-L-gulonate-6-phosphate decarboxylase|tara:strand:- start:102 stop:290 length:189 start_codon:yes stop_codon:yes gene_type:complete
MDLYVNQDVVIRTEDLKNAMMVLVQKVVDAEMQGKKVSEEAKEATKVLHTASLQDDWVMYRP